MCAYDSITERFTNCDGRFYCLCDDRNASNDPLVAAHNLGVHSKRMVFGCSVCKQMATIIPKKDDPIKQLCVTGLRQIDELRKLLEPHQLPESIQNTIDHIEETFWYIDELDPIR